MAEQKRHRGSAERYEAKLHVTAERPQSGIAGRTPKGCRKERFLESLPPTLPLHQTQPSLGTLRTKGWILMDTSLSTAEFIWLREVNGPTFTRYQMPPLSCVIC